VSVNSVELVIEIRSQRNGLARSQSHSRTGFHLSANSVARHAYGGLREPAIRSRVIKLHNQLARAFAATVDDVLGLAHVIVEGRHLVLANKHDLLRIHLAATFG